METAGQFLAAWWIDAAIAGVLVIFAAIGYLRGGLLWLADLAVLAVAILLAFRFFPAAGEWLGALLSLPPRFGAIAGFVALFIAVQLVLGTAVSLFWRFFSPPKVHGSLRVINGLAGIPLGVLFAAVSISMILAMGYRLPLGPELAAALDESYLANGLVLEVRRVPFAAREWLFPAEAERLFAARRLGDDRVVRLPFRMDGIVVSMAEEESIELVNADRAEMGLAPLRFDSQLRRMAREHSREMLSLGYFSHTSPDGRGPVERALEIGYQFEAIGENIALAPSLGIAHRGLMRSDGHRANVLSADFTKLGVGIYDAGLDGLMITQTFAR